MVNHGREFPAVLAEAHSAGFVVDHEGHDFEPYDEFLWSGETLEWWRAWTGDPTVETTPFLVYGQDGSGGLAAFWIRDPGAANDEQPLVFLGSEGELTVIASNLGDYLWLLANGVGPLETVDGVDRELESIDSLMSIARRFTDAAERPVAAVFAAAQAEQAAFAEFVTAATRQMTPRGSREL